MIKALELLLPFLAEAFLGNEDVKKAIKSPKFLSRIAMFAIVGFFVVDHGFGFLGIDIWHDHNDYDKVSRDYRELDEKYRESLVQRDNTQTQLDAEKKRNRALATDLENTKGVAQRLRTYINSNQNRDATCTPSKTRRNDVNRMLDQIEE